MTNKVKELLDWLKVTDTEELANLLEVEYNKRGNKMSEEREEYGWFCKYCNEYVKVLEDKKVRNMEYCSKCNSVVVFYIQKKEK